MNFKINYNECITNLACSIRKYFNLEYKHNTLEYIDELLDKKKPDNVIVILFDAMGSKILDRTLSEKDFFIKNKYKNITTVFPTTTTAATTSMLTGLNPKEHGWLGWNMYIEPIDKTITLFWNSEKGSDKVCEEFLKVKSKLVTKDIIEEINDKKEDIAIKLFPFGDNKYENIDDMLQKIKDETKKRGKKFIYAYDDEPDQTMHEFGPDSDEVKALIKERNDKVEMLCENLQNSLVIVLADHGQIKVDNINLTNYPEMFSMLERTISIENRAVAFKIKHNFKEKFPILFNSVLGNYFNLYTKDEVIKNDFYGLGSSNELFESALGDFMAVATNETKALITESEGLCSIHGGLHDDEVFIPLIIIDRCDR